MISFENKSLKMNRNIKKAAFLGMGRMGKALSDAFIKEGIYTKNEVVGTHHNAVIANEISQSLGFEIITSNSEAIEISEMIYLCIRPQQIPGIIDELKSKISSEKILVSIAVGVPLKWLRNKLKNCGPIFHVHPSSLVMAKSPGVSYITCEEQISQEIKNEVENIWKALGDTYFVEEKTMDFCAVFSGTSSAFFSRLAIIWEKLAVKYAFSEEMAHKIVIYIFNGFYHAYKETNLNFEEIEDKIATPGGVTRAGLKKLDEEGFEEALENVVIRSLERIEEIRSIFKE